MELAKLAPECGAKREACRSGNSPSQRSAARSLRRAGQVVAILLLGLAGCSDRSASTDRSTSVGGSFAGELSADVFTLDRSCAYDFITGDEAGHWLLNIGNGWGQLSPGRHDVSLSDVYGSVTVGEDLWANHCNDVVLPSTPEPIPADEWRIVEGWFVMPDVAARSGPSITITLSDLVVETDQGPIALDPIEITSQCYGCGPG